MVKKLSVLDQKLRKLQKANARKTKRIEKKQESFDYSLKYFSTMATLYLCDSKSYKQIQKYVCELMDQIVEEKLVITIDELIHALVMRKPTKYQENELDEFYRKRSQICGLLLYQTNISQFVQKDQQAFWDGSKNEKTNKIVHRKDCLDLEDTLDQQQDTKWFKETLLKVQQLVEKSVEVDEDQPYIIIALELCVGTGRFISFVVETFQQLQGIHVLDICKTKAEKVKLENPSIVKKAYGAPIQRLQFKNNKYHLTYGNWSLGYVSGPDLYMVMRALYMSLYKSGFLVLAENVLGNQKRSADWQFIKDQCYYVRSSEFYINLAELCGFEHIYSHTYTYKTQKLYQKKFMVFKKATDTFYDGIEEFDPSE